MPGSTNRYSLIVSIDAHPPGTLILMKNGVATNKRSKRKRLAATLVCLLVAGAAFGGWRVNRATDPTLVDPIELPANLELRSGDIIVAGGVSLQSRLVRSFADDNIYSHVGMIQVTDGQTYVIHAAPKGEGDGGVGDRVGRIPLSTFLQERGYVALSIHRLDKSIKDHETIASQACEQAQAYADAAVPFDASFDLSEASTIYCSELVFLAYQAAGYDWPDMLTTDVSTMVVDGPVITPGNFTTCPGFTTVWTNQSKGK